MAKTTKIEVTNGDILDSLGNFFKTVLEQESIRGILVPRRLPMKDMIMPTLVSDAAAFDGVDPLAPAFPINAAKVVSKLTRKPIGGKIAAVLRPCEIRAFVELVKLKQGAREEVIIIGVDCFGAFKNTDYFRYINDNPAEMTKKFIEDSLSGNVDDNLSAACRSCEYPVPVGADILIGLLGMDVGKELMAQSLTPEGESLLESMGLQGMDVPAGRAGAVDQLMASRKQYRDEMFARTKEATDTIEKMNEYLAHCVNCYNCRVACPVCYCKECVFVTDVFNHEPSQYLKWAFRKGALKMPTDTVFYHITRLAHMSTACVGCGQCSNACPNDIPVMELFRLVSQGTQQAFGYEAGRSIDEKPPLSEFREDEFKEVVGIH